MEAILGVGYPGFLVSVVQQSMVIHPDLPAFFVAKTFEDHFVKKEAEVAPAADQIVRLWREIHA